MKGEATQPLEVLVGEWEVAPQFPGQAPAAIGGRTVFEWMSGGRLLVQRWEVPVAEAPDGLAVIGPDPEGGGYLQHYFDSRGVARVYAMTLGGGVWTLSRTKPDFSRSTSASVSPAGSVLTATPSRAAGRCRMTRA